jgi:hypothetical protein
MADEPQYRPWVCPQCGKPWRVPVDRYGAPSCSRCDYSAPTPRASPPTTPGPTQPAANTAYPVPKRRDHRKPEGLNAESVDPVIVSSAETKIAEVDIKAVRESCEARWDRNLEGFSSLERDALSNALDSLASWTSGHLEFMARWLFFIAIGCVYILVPGGPNARDPTADYYYEQEELNSDYKYSHPSMSAAERFGVAFRIIGTFLALSVAYWLVYAACFLSDMYAPFNFLGNRSLASDFRSRMLERKAFEGDRACAVEAMVAGEVALLQSRRDNR